MPDPLHCPPCCGSCPYCTDALPKAIQLTISGIGELGPGATVPSCGICASFNGTYLLAPTPEPCEFLFTLDPPLTCTYPGGPTYSFLTFTYKQGVVTGSLQYDYWIVFSEAGFGDQFGWVKPIGAAIMPCRFAPFTSTTPANGGDLVFFAQDAFAPCDIFSSVTISATAIF